jgi:hypothetical protein
MRHRPRVRLAKGTVVAGVAVTVAVKPGVVVVSFGPHTVYTFDGEGRLETAFMSGRTFQRALDGRVREKRPPSASGEGPWRRRRRPLSPTAGLLMLDGVYAHVRRHVAELASALAAAPTPAPAGWLSSLLSWDAKRLAAERERYLAVYAPVGMLPPDQYRSVVLQAALGCPWNRCTFCTLYPGRFVVRSPEEFRHHLARVRAFFGAALPGRRWLFVGEGDALSVPTRRLAQLMAAGAAAFPVAPAELAGRQLRAWLADRDEGYVGFSGFLDAASGARRSVAEYAELRALGLRRVHVGLETGHAPLYRGLDKPGHVDDARQTVARLRAAGISASVIVLVGVGGRRFAEAHVRDTLAVLDGMHLGADDLVYLSILRASPGSAYARWARAEGIEALSAAEAHAQYQRLAGALRRPDGPRVAAYDIEEFFY